jgi:CBS domain-containing protein
LGAIVRVPLLVARRMNVSELMTKEVVTITATKTARDASRLMADRGVGGVVVLNSGGVASGIITERDLVSRVMAKSLKPDTTLVGDVMSTPLVTVSTHDSLEKAAEIMSINKVRRLPVMERDSLAGIVTATDMARSLTIIARNGNQKMLNTISEALSRAPGNPK